jgi:hypothetical protein
VVERKTSNPSSREYWSSLEKLDREVKEQIPEWMRGDSQTRQCEADGEKQPDREVSAPKKR